MLSRAAIRAAAETFWRAAGGRSLYGSPPDLERAARRSLPLAFHRVPGLTTLHVAAHAGLRLRSGAQIGRARPLRGCLIADAGVGLVLLDAVDALDEQRLTAAHEVAHFLLHYRAPRERALAAFGEGILAVLDRTRSPTRAEMLSAALRDVPIEPYQHAMVRSGPRLLGRAAVMEAEADDLAIELIAPWEEVRAVPDPTAQSLANKFGLPPQPAARLAGMATRPKVSSGVVPLFGPR